MGGEHNPVMETMKGDIEVGPLSRQPNFPVSLNKSFQDKVGHSGYAPNAVSTGLRLSYEEDEHNSSVTCASEGIKAALPIISSLCDNLKVEIDQQIKELDCYIKFEVSELFCSVFVRGVFFFFFLWVWVVHMYKPKGIFRLRRMKKGRDYEAQFKSFS